MPGLEEKEREEVGERGVDELVYQIKERLRLTNYKARRIEARSSPYKIPHRCEYCLRRHTSRTEDPYQMLQELLNKGCLIKEAVKRLENSELSRRCEPREEPLISPQTDTSINLY